MQQQVQVYMQQIGTFIKMYVSSQILPIYLLVQIDAAFFPQEYGRGRDFSLQQSAITLLLIYQWENEFAKMSWVMYTSLWKQTAVYLCYSVCRSTCLLGKHSFLSFCVRSKTFLQIGHCSSYPLTDVSTCRRIGQQIPVTESHSIKADRLCLLGQTHGQHICQSPVWTLQQDS